MHLLHLKRPQLPITPNTAWNFFDRYRATVIRTLSVIDLRLSMQVWQCKVYLLYIKISLFWSKSLLGMVFLQCKCLLPGTGRFCWARLGPECPCGVPNSESTFCPLYVGIWAWGIIDQILGIILGYSRVPRPLVNFEP